MKNIVYCLQIHVSALDLEIFKLQKCVKYENERIDDIIHCTYNQPNKFHQVHIKETILVNPVQKLLKLGRLLILHATHLQL